MTKKPGAAGGVSRRRGDALERALLQAAWNILLEGGYHALTYEAIAERAGTSRPVLYRRWPDRNQLVLATLRGFFQKHALEVPNSGDLREDAVSFLGSANTSRARLLSKLSAELLVYSKESGMSLKDLRRFLHREGEVEPFERMVARAVERGELADAQRSPRVVNLPFDLLRHEIFTTMRPVPHAVIVEIVDEIWLPLLRRRERQSKARKR